MEVRRPRYFDGLIDRMHNGTVKVVTGIRRCGKTYLPSTPSATPALGGRR